MAPADERNQRHPGTNGIISSVGVVVMDAGATISGVSLPGPTKGVTTGLGNTVTGAGTIIRDTSNAVSNGIGQTGFTANPVGTTVVGLPPSSARPATRSPASATR